ncbi:hypothetical protein [Alkalibacillus haloalkaliphilus]|uniref:Integral membrane protein n=1 Tax=Alkalibacillus haloalkaliphilus TaxID=94136 RepID=A0A511W7Z3_9BACI|nr:hypothetical protein [Alkalibacillus haloalkaliphilus]GEN46173.1 hypothetical protein AHA02nite_19490 [Alkalibacillus haloalkaliphilus]
MNLLIEYQWEIFISLEVLSVVALLLFGVLRYYLGHKQKSLVFILLFIVLLVIEAVLGVIIYQETGEFSTFQLVVLLFVIYALTFGINDFRKLDRWMRKKFGAWRGVELLTDEDYAIMNRQKDPKHVAKVNRISAMIHLLIFVTVQSYFWSLGTENFAEIRSYITDLSWFESGNFEDSPYPNETLYSIGMLWTVIFVIDFIYSWSYTIFPSSKSK